MFALLAAVLAVPAASADPCVWTDGGRVFVDRDACLGIVCDGITPSCRDPVWFTHYLIDWTVEFTEENVKKLRDSMEILP